MNKLFLALGGIALIIGIGYLFTLPKTPEVSFGSITQAGSYHSTTTQNGTAAGIYYVTPTSTAGTFQLGSIIITSSTASQFTVLDANGVSTDTIAVFNVSAGLGTYTFDRFLRYGLTIIVPASFNGNIVTTYR